MAGRRGLRTGIAGALAALLAATVSMGTSSVAAQGVSIGDALDPYLGQYPTEDIPMGVPSTLVDFDNWTGAPPTFPQAGALEITDVSTFSIGPESLDHSDVVSSIYSDSVYENPGILTDETDRQLVDGALAAVGPLDRTNTYDADAAIEILRDAGWTWTTHPPEVQDQYDAEGMVRRLDAARQAADPVAQPFLAGGSASCETPGVVCFPEDQGGTQFSSGATIFAVQTATPFCTMGPPYRSEIVITLTDPSGAVYNGTVPGDIFNNANNMFIIQCDGGTIRTSHLVWDGAGFPEAPDRQARWINTPDVQALVFPPLFVPTNQRIQTFNSDGSGQEGRVATWATTFPADQPAAHDPPLLQGEQAGEVALPDLTDRSVYVDVGIYDAYYVPEDEASDDEPVDPPQLAEDAAVEGGEAESADTTDTSGTTDESGDQEEAVVELPSDGSSDSNTGPIVLLIFGASGLLIGTVYLTRAKPWQPAIDDSPLTYDPSDVITQTAGMPGIDYSDGQDYDDHGDYDGSDDGRGSW